MGSMSGGIPEIETPPTGLNGRKRKAIGLPDTTAGGCGSRIRTYKRLAPMPDTSNSQFTGSGELIGRDEEPEIKKNSPYQPSPTILGAIPTIGAGVKSGHTPTSGTLSGSVPGRRTGETRITDHTVSEDLNRSPPAAWGFMGPIGFSSQSSGFLPADAPGYLPSILSPLGIHSGRQLPEPGWTQDTTLSLVTCPWRSHLEVITSIDLSISDFSRRASSTTVEPLLKEGLGILLDNLVELKRSYFQLQKSIQHPTQLSGAHQDGQTSHLGPVY